MARICRASELTVLRLLADVGSRDVDCAHDFMNDVAERIVTRIQHTSDGHYAYLGAVESVFGIADIDNSQLVKLYGVGPGSGPERKFSPGKCNGSRTVHVFGRPDTAHVSTSNIERQNLSLRMAQIRFTRDLRTLSASRS